MECEHCCSPGHGRRLRRFEGLSIVREVGFLPVLMGLMASRDNREPSTGQSVSSSLTNADIEDTISQSIGRLLASASGRSPDVDLLQLHYAFVLPPYVNIHQFSIFRKVAEEAGVSKAVSARIVHTDKRAHMSYNSLYCLYHSHPYSQLCASGELERGIFDALVFDYSEDLMTITWLETVSPLVFRRKGMVDRELGGERLRDRGYWLRLEGYVVKFLREIDEEHKRRGLRPPADEVGRNQIILLGSMGDDWLLRAFLRDAFAGTGFDIDDSLVLDGVDPAVVDAHSAASAVKAVFDAPEPEACYEPAECVELSERIYEDAKNDAVKKGL